VSAAVPRRIALAAVAAAACCALLAAPRAATAQGIAGTVLDASTRAPIAGVALTVVDAGGRDNVTVMSDSLGRFRAVLHGAGDYTLRAEQIGYATLTSVAVRVAARELVTVEIRLGPLPVALEPLVVQGRGPLRADGLDEYRRRLQQQRRSGFGRVIDREEIDRFPSVSMSSLLQREMRVRVQYTQTGRRYSMRGRGADCTPVVYLDGMYMGASPHNDLDAFIAPSSVEGVEIYRDIEAPGELRTDGCGVIAVWSRRGEGRPFSWWRMAVGGAIAAAIIFMGFR
jgi:hypothetical protein